MSHFHDDELEASFTSGELEQAILKELEGLG
jgi:hypothetical protein